MLMLLTTLWGVSGHSLFSTWAAMELNLVILVPMMLACTINEGSFSSVKYLLIQSIAGISILSLIFITSYSGLSSSSVSGLSLFFLYKLGAFPFYNWVLMVGESQTWWSLFFILTLQKVLPLYFLQLLGSNMLMKVSILSFMILPIMMIHMKTLKGILIMSSTFILMALLMTTMVLSYKWKFLLSLYAASLAPMLGFGGWIKGGSSGPKFSEEAVGQLLWVILMLSMLGLPPTPGFVMKVDISSSLMFLGMVTPMIIFNLASGALIFMYLSLIMGKIISTCSVHASSNNLAWPLNLFLLMLVVAWMVI